MKKDSIKELSNSELNDKIADLKGDLSRKKMNHAVSTLDNPMQLKHDKKTIARLKTEMRQRELKGNTN
jgi:large subunit ribosomal protein L29